MSIANEAVAEKKALGTIRSMRRQDNAAVASVVRAVLTEFGCVAQGFAVHDPELDALYDVYSESRSGYWVVEHGGKVAGGAGIASLKGGEADVCELQKYYLLRETRGFGYGKALLEKCLNAARRYGFTRCYLETVAHLEVSNVLYVRAGFRVLAGPMGATGHHACNRWYVKEL